MLEDDVLIFTDKYGKDTYSPDQTWDIEIFKYDKNRFNLKNHFTQ